MSARCWVGVWVLAVASAGCAQTAQSKPASDEVSAWLDKAEAAARKLSDESNVPGTSSPRTEALRQIAWSCVGMQQYGRAKAIAADLPEWARMQVLSFVPCSLALNGQFDAAVREAQALGKPGILKNIAAAAAKTDITKAMAIAAMAPQEFRPYVYLEIVHQQVLRGDVPGATKTARLIPEAQEEAGEAGRWIAAGRVAWSADIPKAVKEANVAPAGMDKELVGILETCLDGNAPRKAREILAVLAGPDQRSRAWVAFAKYYDAKVQTSELRQAIEHAMKETAAIPDGNDRGLTTWGAVQRGANYLIVATLQMKMGDVEESLQTAAKAQKAGDEEANNWNNGGLSVVKTLGRPAIVGLYAAAGRLEEATTAAIGEDGKVDPQCAGALVAEYAAAGRTDDLRKVPGLGQAGDFDYGFYLAAAQGAWRRAQAGTKPSPMAASGPGS